MIQTSIGGRANISMTPWRHMKHTASMPVDGGVHEADLLRYYMGEFKLVYGETRLHETVRYKTDSTGPGGFYGGYLATMPDTIEPTGDDALYAYITFESGASASGSTTTPATGCARTSAWSTARRAPSRRSATASASRARSTSTTAP